MNSRLTNLTRDWRRFFATRQLHQLHLQVYGEIRRLADMMAEREMETLRRSERHAEPGRLGRFEHGVTSQGGEDGVIAEIFRRIGETNRSFVEFGVGDGLENNTALLLVKGWRGLWLEGDDEKEKAVRRNLATFFERGALTVQRAFIDADNIESLFQSNAVPSEPDLLSIDIDGNDYWVWKAIQSYRPRVVIIEYNPAFPPDVSWVMRYNAGHRWNATTYYGASLKALEKLGTEKGYRLVGCSLSGINAFFVRGDLVGDAFAAPFTAEHHYEPARYSLLRKTGHPIQHGPFESV
jgi:hypothetical protein